MKAIVGPRRVCLSNPWALIIPPLLMNYIIKSSANVLLPEDIAVFMIKECSALTPIYEFKHYSH